MNTQPITTDPKTFAGIDIGKSSLDVALVCGAEQQLHNTKKGHHSMLTWLRAHAVTQVVCEPSGGYEKPLVAFLQSSEITVSVVHPNRVRGFATGLGYQAKTDRLDAQVLAQYGGLMEPQPTLPVDPQTQQLRDTTDRRRQLVVQRAQEKIRLKQATSDAIVASHRRQIAFLDKDIARLDAGIDKALGNGSELAQRAELLCSVKGVGKNIASILLANLPELGKISNKSLSALVGVAPWSRDSGRQHGKRSIRGGRKVVRGALYMAALSAVRFDPEMKRLYEGLLQRGKPAKVALVAVMRKRLLLLNSIAKRGTPWVENHPSAP